MDLLIIPVLLSLGGALIYLGLHGMPRLSLSQLPLRPNGEPFNLTQWLKTRPAAGRRPASQAGAYDAELVELMNEMIAVREELSGLKLAMATRPSRRRGPRTVQPENNSDGQEKAAARRQPYNGPSRRYVRT